MTVEGGDKNLSETSSPSRMHSKEARASDSKTKSAPKVLRAFSTVDGAKCPCERAILSFEEEITLTLSPLGGLETIDIEQKFGLILKGRSSFKLKKNLVEELLTAIGEY